MNKILYLISCAMNDTKNDIVTNVRDNIELILTVIIGCILFFVFIVSFFFFAGIAGMIGVPMLITLVLGVVFSLAVCYMSNFFLKNLAYHLACNLVGGETLEEIGFSRRNF